MPKFWVRGILSAGGAGSCTQSACKIRQLLKQAQEGIQTHPSVNCTSVICPAIQLDTGSLQFSLTLDLSPAVLSKGRIQKTCAVLVFVEFCRR